MVKKRARRKEQASKDAKLQKKPAWKRVDGGMWEGEVHGYRVLGLSSGRLLFLRRHRGGDAKAGNNEEGEEAACSGLFIGNVSPRIDGAKMRDVVGGNGKVMKGRMSSSSSGGGGGWFLRIDMDRERIGRLLDGEIDVKGVEEVVEDGEVKGGVEVWLRKWEAERYGVREWARKVMEEWENTEREEKERRKGKAITDDEGWTVVGRSGGGGEGRDGKIGSVSRAQAEAVLSKKRKRAEEMGDEMRERFYKFQRIEQQRKQVRDLRKRWEEQKQKISSMAKLKS